VLVVFAAGVVSACADGPTKAARYTASGDAYTSRRQFNEAVIEYRRALAETPAVAALHYKLGRVYQETGDLVNAYLEYARAGDLDSSNIDAHMRAGTILLLGREFDAAKARAALALQADAQHVPARVLLANAQAGQNATSQAMREIQEAIKLDPSYAPAWTALGAITFMGDRTADAAVAYKKAVQLAPRSIEARLALANYERATGADADAERTLKSALEIDARNAGVHRALVLMYMSAGRREEAEPHFRALATDGAGRLALADYYRGVGRPAEAIKLLEELAHSPEKSDARDARLRLASIDYAAGKTIEAHRVVDALIAEKPNYASARATKARMLLDDGAPPREALAQAREAVKADPYLPAAQYTLGLAAFAERNLDESAKALEETLKLSPGSAAVRMNLARVKLAQGDAAGAVAIAERAAYDRPADAGAAVLFAQALRASGDPDRAKDELTKRLASGLASEAPLHAELGWVELQRGEAAAARAAFYKALRDTPTSPGARHGIIAAQLAEKKIDMARRQIAEWTTAGRADPALGLLSADVELAGGNLAGAEQTLKSVIANDASQLEAYERLGRVYAGQGRIDEAVAQFEALAQRSPSAAAGARTVAGILYESRHDRHAARRSYEQALASDAQAGVAANNLAWIYAADGKLDQALGLALTAQASLRRRPEPEDTLGWIYLKKGLTSQAITAFERARERAPRNPVYHYHLGLAQLKSGDPEAARASLARALQLQPDFADAADARTKLAAIDDGGTAQER
jgi:tetratricopeptide (TPR) repeat protein